MGRILINPPGLSKPGAYSHVAIGTGGTIVHFAGQVAFDENGEIVGHGDLRAQVIQTMNNLKIAMDAVGATWDDIVHRKIYATEMGEPGTIGSAIREVTGDAGHPAQATVQVVALARPGLLVEIEAVAILP